MYSGNVKEDLTSNDQKWIDLAVSYTEGNKITHYTNPCYNSILDSLKKK